MKKKRKKITMIGIGLITLLTVGGLLFNKFYDSAEETSAEDSKVSVTMSTKMQTAQEKLEATYKAIFNRGDYTLSSPYIIKNPYKTSPLTALLMFKTDEATKITVEVVGKTASTTIKNTDDTYETTHEVSVLGLYANYNNTVKITATAEDGTVTTQEVKIQTEKLPSAIGKVSVKKSDTTKMDLGDNKITFVIPSVKYSFGIDSDGEVRWYQTQYNSHVFKILKNGHVLFQTKADNSEMTYNYLLEMNFLGKVYKNYIFSTENVNKEGASPMYTIIHHDAIELPSGNLLLTVNENNTYIEDTLIEIDRETGKTVKTIDFKKILPASFYQKYSSTKSSDGKVDWLHNNSVTYNESDNSIIISSRHQDAVIKINYSTLKIVWILSDSSGWPEEYKKYLLKATGDNFKINSGQHAVIILPDQDNNADTMDILMFDNNIAVTRGDKTASGKYSRAVQYRINEKTNTVSQVWTFGEDLGSDYFAAYIGSARYLDNGNRLVDYGYREDGKKSSFFEVTESGEVVFEVDYSDFPDSAWVYRAERYALTDNQAENTILSE